MLLERKYEISKVRQGGVSDFLEDEIRRCFGGVKRGEKSLGDFYLGDRTAVNIKSMDIGRKFHMPNLVSAKKAYDFLSEHENFLNFYFVMYRRDGDSIEIVDNFMKSIEELAGLAIRAQGKGVIQLNGLNFRSKVSRDVWLQELREMMRVYLLKEEAKIAKSRIYFELN